jgi:hypothetical protein
MAEPAPDAPYSLEAAVEQAIAICDGDVRAALRAALVANSFWADEVERLTRVASFGSARGRISPARRASAKLDRWREISAGSETDMPRWPQEIADAVLFDIRYGLNFKVGARSRPATDQEIELVARTIVERLQQANWVIKRAPPAPLGDTPNAYGTKECD